MDLTRSSMQQLRIGPARTDTLTAVGAQRWALLPTAVVLALTGLAIVPSANAATRSGPKVTTFSLTMPHAYQPRAAPGTTDDYHCTLLNPHLNRNSYIISSEFIPGSNEDHHAALFLVPPSSAAAVERDNRGGKGWTCFGGPLPGTALTGLAADPLLTFWAPGHGADNFPTGTGVPLRAGSLVIMQVHYNLLVGHRPVKNSLVLRTVPDTVPLLPLHLDLLLAPPNIPCPVGVTGPLCNRTAALADLARRFGQTAVTEVNGIEATCGENPADPPQGDSSSCVLPISKSGFIVRVYAHMHLLGVAFKMVLNPGTPEAKTVLSVPDYDFHDQRSYNLTKPVPVTAGEPAQVTCTYEPTLAEELPVLRKVPPHFVTWGDGSTDEMCIGLAWTSSTLPSVHASY
jgi:Copper type II ascorbate-dependent monooxygenase, C-terminal domain